MKYGFIGCGNMPVDRYFTGRSVAVDALPREIKERPPFLSPKSG